MLLGMLIAFKASWLLASENRNARAFLTKTFKTFNISAYPPLRSAQPFGLPNNDAPKAQQRLLGATHLRRSGGR